MATACEDEIASIKKCQRGSREAFEPIVKRYMKDSYYIALGLVGSHDDALELSQEAFYRAYKNLKTLKPGRKFFPWFYQILRNLCFSHLRKMRLRKTQPIEDSLGREPAADCNEYFDPELICEQDELKKRVWQCISKLNEKHREVIILRHFQDMSYDQIAAALFCSKGTVMSRLYNARKKLKELLEPRKEGRTYEL